MESRPALACGDWRRKEMKKSGLLAFCVIWTVLPLFATSYYPVRLEDAKAVYLTPENFSVHADGVADDSAAIQASIDRAAQSGEGIVFVPSGRYRLTRTLYVWPAVRVIGYGATRPVFVLGDNTPGYQQGLGYMVLFAGGKPRPEPRIDFATGAPARPIEGTVPPDASVPDASPGTFYSAMSNVDFEIGKNNPAAVAIRIHAAQHCYLAHMDFWIGSGLTALKDIGNEAEDLHFHGGQYGIVTVRPSPGWQFTLVDSSFDGQSQAAIKEHEAGLTLIHDSFRNVPHAISIDPEYSEELWVKNSRFEEISGPAIVFGNEKNARTEINLENIACRHVKVFAQMRESGRTIAAPGDTYVVNSFTHGLTLNGAVDWGNIETKFDAHPVTELPPAGRAAIAALPLAATWVNLQSLGIKGDGVTDETAAIQKAIDEHPTLYVPMGRYLVTDTIHLRPETVLIGLHPSMTQFDLKDESSAFQGTGAPRALLETPKGGHNIVTGIGLFTGEINDRAVGALWMAGADSLMDDVRFLGGHGTNTADGKRMNPYNSTHTGDPNPRYRWDAQYPSLWITDGGGGTFANIWTPSTFAAAGMLISNTSTPGHVYELSSEHHVRNEIRLDRAENWELYALQTEEERGESPDALPLEIDRSKNITVANYHSYRVISSYAPYPYAVRVSESTGIRFRNIHVYSNSKVSFDNSIFDSTHRAEVRAREFASLDVPGNGIASAPADAPAELATHAQVERLATGFFSASGGAVDAAGALYFVDTHWQRIFRWDAQDHEAEVVSSDPLAPENLALDKAGDLLVVSRNGAGEVYSIRPNEADPMTLLPPRKATESEPGAVFLPSGVYGMYGFAESRTWQYPSADGTALISAGDDFAKGHMEWGTKMADLLRAFGLQQVVPGHPFYLSSESEERTYKGSVTSTGSVTGTEVFAEAGGESVVQDKRGNVYVAAGQILVYSPAGKLIEKIDVPERPIDLVFGGADRRTLFILTHHSLYSVKTQVAGL
jgi:Pectate lyase superfamily protein/SMP-30/Gluconolactonase/LRE-like region